MRPLLAPKRAEGAVWKVEGGVEGHGAVDGQVSDRTGRGGNGAGRCDRGSEIDLRGWESCRRRSDGGSSWRWIIGVMEIGGDGWNVGCSGSLAEGRRREEWDRAWFEARADA